VVAWTLGSCSPWVLVLVSNWVVSVVWWVHLAGVLTWILFLFVAFMLPFGHMGIAWKPGPVQFFGPEFKDQPLIECIWELECPAKMFGKHVRQQIPCLVGLSIHPSSDYPFLSCRHPTPADKLSMTVTALKQ